MSICTFCNTEIVASIRWCPICHTNVVNPVIGRLASPGKRVGAFFADLLLPGSALLLFFAIAPRGAATDAGAGIGGFLGALLFLAYIIWAFVLFARAAAYRASVDQEARPCQELSGKTAKLPRWLFHPETVAESIWVTAKMPA